MLDEVTIAEPLCQTENAAGTRTGWLRVTHSEGKVTPPIRKVLCPNRLLQKSVLAKGIMGKCPRGERKHF
jgi:hypothetical protein